MRSSYANQVLQQISQPPQRPLTPSPTVQPQVKAPVQAAPKMTVTPSVKTSPPPVKNTPMPSPPPPMQVQKVSMQPRKQAPPSFLQSAINGVKNTVGDFGNMFASPFRAIGGQIKLAQNPQLQKQRDAFLNSPPTPQERRNKQEEEQMTKGDPIKPMGATKYLSVDDAIKRLQQFDAAHGIGESPQQSQSAQKGAEFGASFAIPGAQAEGGLEAAAPFIKNAVGGVAKNAANFVSRVLPKAAPKIEQAAVKIIPKVEQVAVGQAENAVQTPVKAAAQNAGKTAVQTISQSDPVQKVITALKEAKPLRTAQEEAYTAARSQRVATSQDAFQAAGGGRAGHFAQLNALKGQLADKPSFTPIEHTLTPDDISALHNKIAVNPNLAQYDRVNASTGLEKLLKGQVPQEHELVLLRDTFGKEFVSAATKARTKLGKIAGTVIDAANLPRAIMSSIDLSAPLRQGVFLAPSHPKEFAGAFKSMFKYAFSEKAYEGLGQEIMQRQTYPLMRKSGLALTDIGGKLSMKEEGFMSNLAEKLPLGVGKVIRGSDRAYSGFLNKLRADTFDHLIANGAKLGKGSNEKFVKDVAMFVNDATGRGSLGALNGSAPLLNSMFFSPRLIASRVRLIASPLTYMRADPMIRKEVAKSSVAFVTTGMTILGLAKVAGADVGIDPRSSDFGKIKMGNTRYDIWGGFQQYARLIGQLTTGQKVNSTTGKEYNLGTGRNPVTRADIGVQFGASKLSPIPSFLYGWANQTQQQPFEIPKEVLNRFSPMLTQDLRDAIAEHGVAGGAATVLPSIFGVGTQTYGKAPLRSKLVPKQ